MRGRAGGSMEHSACPYCGGPLIPVRGGGEVVGYKCTECWTFVDIDDGSDEYEGDEHTYVCDYCEDTGADPLSDGLMRCPMCCGSQTVVSFSEQTDR